MFKLHRPANRLPAADLLQSLLDVLTLLDVCDFSLLNMWSQSVLLPHPWDLVDRLSKLRHHDHHLNTFNLHGA